MKFYIAGKISGDRHYRKKFARIERQLRSRGHSVMNPAWLVSSPEFNWDDYMSVSGAMQLRCEAVFFIPDWKESRGACTEYGRGTTTGQIFFFNMRDVPNIKNKKKEAA